jgi:hypothetical protein
MERLAEVGRLVGAQYGWFFVSHEYTPHFVLISVLSQSIKKLDHTDLAGPAHCGYPNCFARLKLQTRTASLERSHTSNSIARNNAIHHCGLSPFVVETNAFLNSSTSKKRDTMNWRVLANRINFS